MSSGRIKLNFLKNQADHKFPLRHLTGPRVLRVCFTNPPLNILQHSAYCKLCNACGLAVVGWTTETAAFISFDLPSVIPDSCEILAGIYGNISPRRLISAWIEAFMLDTGLYNQMKGLPSQVQLQVNPLSISSRILKQHDGIRRVGLCTAE